MAPAGSHEGNNHSTGLELSRMERVDDSSQGSEQSGDGSDKDEDAKSRLSKAVMTAEHAWTRTWDWIKL